jgi:predicted nucleotide-binding protein
VAPTADTNLNAELRKALLHSPIFQTVYGWLDRKPIPKEDVFRNTLIKPSDLGGFGIPKEDVDEFVRVFMQNIEAYGLADETAQGVKYLRLDKLSPAVVVSEETPPPPVEFQLDLKRSSTSELSTPPPSTEFQPQVPKQIFVAHGKNKKPLDQLEKILNKFKVPYKVAEEEAHIGRPISGKVAQLMRSCTSGIFIFTADEETQDAQGAKVFRPSDNVVYELGAASVLYGKKIVILKEKDVDFASDFSDLGHIPFEKDKLDATAADVMVELIGLGFLEVRPT